MTAQVCGLQPGEFVHTLGDTHLYLNHLEQDVYKRQAQKRTEAPAASSEVRYVGRTQTKGGDVSFDWSGTSFECRFTGGSLAMQIGRAHV